MEASTLACSWLVRIHTIPLLLSQLVCVKTVLNNVSLVVGVCVCVCVCGFCVSRPYVLIWFAATQDH